ncbi:hypothetical protein OE88DRAFT_1655312 [Heliocybe sulcata]|uniref:Uncharacterized protein n=1 Tax=Heliocybe sulcata TaxID=5364 RepID=A0A5C3NEV5_9AGAM|nr:hypothetical protein OE88DRAFT_1655312 [Heliocybe sulcata]
MWHGCVFFLLIVPALMCPWALGTLSLLYQRVLLYAWIDRICILPMLLTPPPSSGLCSWALPPSACQPTKHPDIDSACSLVTASIR